jgi:hypothetical protein
VNLWVIEDSQGLEIPLLLAGAQRRLVGFELEAAGAAGGVVKHEADEGLAVVDLVCVGEGQGFRKGEADGFDLFVELGCGSALADVASEVDLHPLAEEAGAGEVLCQQRPAFRAVAGLFDHLALGGGEGGFAGFDAAGREFDKELAGSVAVLAFKDDVWVCGVAGLVYGEDDDGAVVADDVAGIEVAAGLYYFVGVNVEDFAFVRELGGDEAGFFRDDWGFPDGDGGGWFGCLGLEGAGFGRLLWLVGGLLYLCGHEAKVSSCI